MTPKQDVIHYFSFILESCSMIKDNMCVTTCGLPAITSRSTWKVTKVTCEECLKSPAYQNGVVITMSRRLKGRK